MRQIRIVSAGALACVLLLGLAPGAAAGPPNPGSRDIQSFANAWFTQDIGECVQAQLHVGFAGGDNLQNPIGSGAPGPWADVELTLEVRDTCQDVQLARFEGSGLHPNEVDLFTSAIVSGVEMDLWDGDGNSVHAWVDLFWEATGDPVTTTDNHDSYQRVQRMAPAVITPDGRVVLSGNPLWGDELRFTFDENDTADLGWAAEISMPTPPPCAAPADGMTSWWTGDGTTDDVIGGHDATAVGGARFGAGKVRSAFSLNGSGAYLDAGNAEALNVGAGDFTVEAWVRFDVTDGEQVLIERWFQGWDTPSLGWTLTKLENNALLLAVSSPDGYEVGAATDEGTFDPGRWYFVAARRSGQETAVFVDGVQAASAWLDDGPAWDLSSQLPLVFGHRADERGLFLDGSLDEIQLFVGTAVSDADIWAAYAAGTSGTCRK